jgi:predicted AAA+ superfamily ATPase
VTSYIQRIADAALAEYLGVFGAVIIEGARATGKTTTAKHAAASAVSLDTSPQLAGLAQADPSVVFAGETPRLVDEWQLAPNVWNALRHEVDVRGLPGQFILAGSATPSDEVTRHSGAGRFGRIRLRPMSLFEAGISSGALRFGSLLERGTGPVSGVGGPDVRGYAASIVKGGWPATQPLSESQATLYLRSYLEHIISVDIEGKPDAERMRVLIRALARNLSTEAAIRNLAQEARIFAGSSSSVDGSVGEGVPKISEATTRKYLDGLTRIFVLEELHAWPTHIVSKVRQRVSPKWHFVDPSLAAAALGLSADALLAEPLVLGFFFESLAIRDMRIYAEGLGGSVTYYRDETGLEVDAIVELMDGRWAGFEVKLGGDAFIDEGARNLLKLKGKLSSGKQDDLVTLNVLTAGSVSYTRSDGVNVIALAHLGV